MTERPEDEPDRGRDDELTDADLTGENLERRFTELVAGLEPPDWPEEEREPERTGPAVPEEREEPTLLELWDTELPEDPDDPEENYTPPPPPPVPRPSRPALVGLLIIVAGVVLFLKPTLLGVGENLGVLVAAAVVLSGVAVLIWRLRPGDDDDPYDPDDGAVV